MKKILIVFLSIISFICLFTGCSKQPTLDEYVSELKSDVFTGDSGAFSLKASYGFKEHPFNHDGMSAQKVYRLTVKMLNQVTDGATYTACLIFNSQEYKSEFKIDPVTQAFSAIIEVDNFNLKEFDLIVTNAGNIQTVKMQSILPNDTLTCSEALNKLKESQKELLNNYTDENGIFTGEIHARVLVKDEKPYWYVGLVSTDKSLKALLVDGISGEVLAIRDVL